MRRRTSILAGLVAAALPVLGLVLVPGNASAAANLAANPGFEAGTTGWSCAAGTTVTTPVHSGTHALSATPSASATGQCSQSVSVQPNSSYTLSAWVQGSYVYLGASGTSAGDVSTWTPAATSWTQLTTTFTTGASASSVSVYLHGWYGQPGYFADDVTLTGPGGAPPPTSSPTTPPPTTPTTPTTPTPPSNGSLPTHALVGYLHSSFANGSGYIRMQDVPDAWDVIDLAFAEPTSPTSGQVNFQLCPVSECPTVESQADFIAAVKAKQAQGKKVLISIGGQNGQVQLTTTAARDAFVSSVSAIIDRYGLDGLDVDFEGNSLSLNTGDRDFRAPTTPSIVNLISALKTLKAKYGANFVLTMAPETFFVQLGYQFYGSGANGTADPRAGAFLPVIYALRNDLTLLHVQDYNSGPIMGLDNQYHTMGVADFHTAMTDMLLSGFPVEGNTANMFPALRPDQVAIGLPASSTAGNGYTAVADVEQSLNCLMKGQNCGSYKPHGTYPALRGLMTWSINWDKFNNNEFSQNYRAFLPR
ncbi:MAG: chitinase [Amycolatopsis sp.]|uniref:chitinase n=1 Tax=Amycolatopsis sp. TaxID=37632 RepID=UPI00261DE519|nr:glycosyl hydrolase family 18 protein [Amycolatopsis sp.]MCU1680782.1 chitinase [Amycolatopsis sp.]